VVVVGRSHEILVTRSGEEAAIGRGYHREGESFDMPGKIHFTYDPVNDIVIATPRWSITTEQDCHAWLEEWAAHLSTYGRKVDCVVVLDDFHVDAQIASQWGEYRARLNNTYFRHSYRVNADPTVKLFIQTSGVRFNAATGEAPSVEGAIAGILDARNKTRA
jgi:hypothetical protein